MAMLEDSWSSSTIISGSTNIVDIDNLFDNNRFDLIPDDVKAKIILATDEEEWILIPKRLLEN